MKRVAYLDDLRALATVAKERAQREYPNAFLVHLCHDRHLYRLAHHQSLHG